MLKKIISITAAIIGMLSSTLSNAADHQNQDCQPFHLPIQYAAAASQVKLIGFKSGPNASQYRYINLYQGINYRLIGSGQYTQENLVNELTSLQKQYDLNNLIIVDLRQEYHGYINGLPVTFFLPGIINDAVNAGKSTSQVLQQELSLFNEIKHQDNDLLVNLYYHYLGFAGPYRLHCIEVNRAAFTEAQFLSQLTPLQSTNISYLRIAIQDHHPPNQAEIDQVVKIYDTVLVKNPNTWIYFHCLVGDYRTIMGFSMIALLKQQAAHQLMPFNDFITWMSHVSHFPLFPPANDCPTASTSPRCGLLWDNYHVLEKFYSYVQVRQPNESWSVWVNQ